MPTRKGATTRTVTTVVEDGEGNQQPQYANSPLFTTEDTPTGKEIESIAVYREDPPEGWVGTIAGHATEKIIKDKWGGGSFKLKAYSNGRICKHKTLVIGGDPIFQSKGMEADWYRSKGLTPPSAQSGQMDMPTLLSFFKEQSAETRRSEIDMVERRRQIDNDADDRRRRYEAEMEANRRREDNEREEKRRKDDEERERRRREDDDRRMRESREHMQQMATMLQTSGERASAAAASNSKMMMEFMGLMFQAKNAGAGDPSSLILKGAELVTTLRQAAGGDSEKDIMTTVVENLPGMLESVGSAAKGVVQEIRAPKQPAGQLPPITNPDQTAQALAKSLLDSGHDPAAYFKAVGSQLDKMKAEAQKKGITPPTAKKNGAPPPVPPPTPKAKEMPKPAQSTGAAEMSFGKKPAKAS